MKKSNPTESDLRRKAEAKLGERKKKKAVAIPATKADTLRLIHELEVHQIELEMQNDALIQSRAQAEAAYHQYADLYDFAPVGYFTLTRDGAIRKVNLAGASLLGMEHSELIQRRLGVFVSIESRPAFNVFFEKLLSGKGKKNCELEFEKKGNESLWARLESTCFEGGQECHIVVMNITERKQVEDALRRAMEALEAANRELQIALVRQQHLAHTDYLTGINNRRYFFELVGHEFDIATRYRQPLSVIMFDIDHFKDINDTFGHTIGDQMLERVTQVACEELRSADVIGRYGGEEFVIVMPMTSAQQALPLAERIREGVAAIRVPTEKGDASVTLSIGIAEAKHTSGESVDSIINCADKAMYAAKQAGRNRTEIGEQ